ncbi:MAG: hypothetical protein GWP58_05220 [Gammaproteobacteria bacterium]|jgi:hypothetical protein|nr:hypothetical protein [Gammaproteobacteria bacterium]
MSLRAEVEQAVSLYFEGVNTKNAGIIPLTDDVVLTGPMMPEPVSGEDAVRRHINDVAPFVTRMERKFTVIENDTAAVILEFEGLNGVVIQGAEFFRVREGKICLDQTFFDTRPLLKGAR